MNQAIPHLPPEERLVSWTRTLNEEDAATLLDAASPGLSLETWADIGHSLLPQAGRERRNELLRIVRESLLDLDDEGIIQESAFLTLFLDGNATRRRGLIQGRLLYHRHRPLTERALQLLILPAIRRAEVPLAPRDAATIDDADWWAFLQTTLKEGTGPSSYRKTATTLQRALERCGSLDIKGSNKTRITCAKRADPDPLAFAWLIAHQLHAEERPEASENWALNHSFSAQLFAPSKAYAQPCIERGIARGLLRRGYLDGAPRLHPGEEL